MYFEEEAKIINYCKEANVPYMTESISLMSTMHYIYIYDAGLYNLKKSNKEKYKDLYVPYIRLNWECGMWYVRDNGYCDYMPESVIFERIDELK